MQKNEVIEFLGKIDAYLAGKPFNLKIIGKSALLLSGLTDSVGTVDIDSLGVDGKHPPTEAQKTSERLLAEFGRARMAVHGYYLEFVAPAIVFLPQTPTWILFPQKYGSLTVEYLEPHYVVASKMFSAFSTPPRKRDRQDIAAALDQKLVSFQKTLDIADKIFDFYSMDARNDRFPAVFKYITKDLMSAYGKARLRFSQEEE